MAGSGSLWLATTPAPATGLPLRTAGLAFPAAQSAAFPQLWPYLVQLCPGHMLLMVAKNGVCLALKDGLRSPADTQRAIRAAPHCLGPSCGKTSPWSGAGRAEGEGDAPHTHGSATAYVLARCVVKT